MKNVMVWGQLLQNMHEVKNCSQAKKVFKFFVHENGYFISVNNEKWGMYALKTVCFIRNFVAQWTYE